MYDPKIINEAIKSQKLTNEKVGVSAGVAARTVTTVRQGSPDLNLKSLNKVAAALGFDVDIRFVPKPGVVAAEAALS